MYEAELVGRRVNFGYDTNVSDRAAGPRTSKEHEVAFLEARNIGDRYALLILCS